MTAKQEDILSVFVKKWIPVLSIIGSLIGISVYFGGHFAVVEANQTTFAKKQDDGDKHMARIDTSVQGLKDQVKEVNQKFETLNLKLQLGYYSRALNRGRAYTTQIYDNPNDRSGLPRTVVHFEKP